MSREIHEPIEKEFYEQIESGEKTFALQAGNFDYKKGDILILEETQNGIPTSRSIRKKIGWSANTKKLGDFMKDDIEKHGLEIISLVDEDEL